MAEAWGQSMSWEPSRLRQYLLGSISEQARSDFELQLLSNRDFLAAIELAEEELIEDYLDEQLTVDELERFKDLFLKSPERMIDIEISQQLRINTKQSTDGGVTGLSKSDRNPNHGSVANRYRFLRPAFAIPSLALLIILVSSYIFLQTRTVKTAQSSEDLSQLNQRDLSSLSEFADVTRLTLIAQTTRDSAELQTLFLGSTSDLILVRLALPPGITSQRFYLRIQNNQFVTNLKNIRTYSNQSMRDVRILIPKAHLTVGGVLIEITDEHSTSPIAAYAFAVE